VAPLVEREHARRKPESLANVVRDHRNRKLVFAPQSLDQHMHVATNTGIERAERFVEQQDAWPLHQCLRDSQALLHAARHLCGIKMSGVAEAHSRKHRVGLIECSPASLAEQASGQRCSRTFETEQNIVTRVEVRENRVALEHDASIGPAFGLHRHTIEEYLATRRSFLAEQQAQQCAFARP